MNRRQLIRAGLLASTGIASLGWLTPARAAPNALYDLEFPTPQDQSRSLKSFLGKPLVVNFWATWCPPCVKEMPDLDDLAKEHTGVNIVGLAVDTARNVIEFEDKVQVSYPLLVAGHGGIQLMKELGNPQAGLPFTIVFDADGTTYKTFLGQIDPSELGSILADVAAD